MNQAETLTKAIEKAVANGYDKSGKDWTFIESHIIGMAPVFIFSHDFAKALWGEHGITNVTTTNASGFGLLKIEKVWQQHLMRMVIADDPLQYLAEHI